MYFYEKHDIFVMECKTTGTRFQYYIYYLTFYYLNFLFSLRVFKFYIFKWKRE